MSDPKRVPIPAAGKLFTTGQLEQWKDQIAVWWGKEKLRYDHKRTVELFRKWFGVSKEEAIEMEFNSASARRKPSRWNSIHGKTRRNSSNTSWTRS